MTNNKKDSILKEFAKWLMRKWNSFLYMLMFKNYE